ncbi:MAG: LacI family transcriptional regulator [Melioribacteraceae bacterium]|nr:LacI family transcriptional regulator [Melioribacteraceae bacterium]MCF8355457.1 LacI family transcriptional regulator [Melioribacteraceae bacterium]MCF8392566.1 LacI family transcriptional regulator [Melioribacteraceae bacterium]MCF8418419.1 LacI family transcriptional regulator [Melioribacteraceae bacterium]
MITINDIANQVGVSISTVSRVLNHKSKKYRISSKTEEQILKAADELGYRPNELARGLRLKKTHSIGLVVPDIANPFFANVTQIIQKQAYEAGYSLIVCNTNEDISLEIEHVELLRRKGVDGYIIMPVGTLFEHIEDLVEHKKPLVLLDRNIEHIDANCVVVDNYKGAFQATSYLIENGHTRIAIIQGLRNTYTNNERVKGYLDALRKNGLEIDETLMVGKDFRKENGYIETKMLLNLENPPTAIFAFSDLITLGTLQAFLEESIKVPEDISLITFDDIDFAPYLFSPLTAVRQPRQMLGEVAVKLLIDDLKSKGRIERKKIVLDPKLITRKSVKLLTHARVDTTKINMINQY